MDGNPRFHLYDFNFTDDIRLIAREEGLDVMFDSHLYPAGCTHLLFNVPEADQAVMRRNEAYLVRRHVDAILAQSPGANLLLYGDLNDTRNEPTVREIQGPFGSPTYLRDIQVADADGYRWTYYWRYADIYSRFDFALASPGLYPEVLLDRSLIVSAPDWFTASDHRPVVVRLVPVDRETP